MMTEQHVEGMNAMQLKPRTEGRIITLQYAEASAVAAAIGAGKLHSDNYAIEQARRIFVADSIDQKRQVPMTISGAYSSWVASAIKQRGGLRSLGSGFDRKIHWFMCTYALGLEAAYTPALAREIFGTNPQPWLGCVQVYTAWQGPVVADLLACLAEVGLLTDAHPDMKPPLEEHVSLLTALDVPAAQRQLISWLSTALVAFEERLALAHAVVRCDTATLSALIDGSCRHVFHMPLPDWPPSGDLCLHLAAACGHVEAVQLLLKHGASVDAPNYAGVVALHKAASKGSETVAALLLSHGAAVDTAVTRGVYDCAVGATALHISAAKGRLGIAKLLVAEAATVQARDCHVIGM
jgi:hypothetical protein